MRRRSGEGTPLRIRLAAGGTGRARLLTGVPVLEGLLTQLARTAEFDLELETAGSGGEAEADAIGRALGEALAELLDRPGAAGLGSATAPADEALAQVSVEASGRPLLVSNVDLTAAHLEGIRGDLLQGLLESMAEAAGLTLHIRLLHGEDTQHVLDAIGKALGLALAQACAMR